MVCLDRCAHLGVYIRRNSLEKLTYTHNDAAAKAWRRSMRHRRWRMYAATGCQQNVNDGEKIKGVCRMSATACATMSEHADLILFNTCAVREHAEQRVFGNVGALKKLRSRTRALMIGVCGCIC